MTFGARLRTARETAELTQAELGRGLGTDEKDASKSVVMGWEKDKHHPRADQLALICTKLKCSADYLLFGTKADSVLSDDARKIASQLDSLEEEDRRTLLQMWDMAVKLAGKQPAELPSEERKFKGTQ